MTRTYHVAKTGLLIGDGSPENPFLTINQAAAVAFPGDTIVVHEGVYREWVTPARGGLSDSRRITYMAAPEEKVVIKGSEPITGWEHDENTTWKAEVPNQLFGNYNPFAEEVEGDWTVYPHGAPRKHLGDVYLNGLSFYEAASVAEVRAGKIREEVIDNWTEVPVAVSNVAQTGLQWYAQVGTEFTTIWANFQGVDPNQELVEINVRRSVFYPTEHHLDYITVSGFEMGQAACPWTPPTADQPGLIGPNWAKGWIIENNRIHDAKCSAISLGKEKSTGHNFATLRGDKPGYQYQLESVFSARQIGWDKEHVGSHIIRNNEIYDCGQNGVVGHLGCVFSKIENNHIHDIAVKREFYGYEIAGIKLHAAIDVTIEHNRIHSCSLGTWLDWQTQGTRVTRNLYYDNSRDIFIEVSHGPYLVDNNIFASPAAIELFSQGGAFVNNLICGTVRIEPVMDRATPYHYPHSTQVAGYAVIYGGDDRFIGNIFAGDNQVEAYGPQAVSDLAIVGLGTSVYDAHPASFAEYMTILNQQPDGDHARFPGVKQAVYIRDNAYANGAESYAKESQPIQLGQISVTVMDEGGQVFLQTVLPQEFEELKTRTVTSDDLERVRFVDADFEAPDGGQLVIETDLVGQNRCVGEVYSPGPLVALTAGQENIQIW